MLEDDVFGPAFYGPMTEEQFLEDLAMTEFSNQMEHQYEGLDLYWEMYHQIREEMLQLGVSDQTEIIW